MSSDAQHFEQAMRAYILHVFAIGNPVLAFNHCNYIKEPEATARLMRTLSRKSLPMYGDLAQAEKAFADIPGLQADIPMPRVAPVTHAFPVYADAMSDGLMVPLHVAPSDEWHISDAFAAATLDIAAAESPNRAFGELLDRIVSTWEGVYPGSTLPIRWRRAFSMTLLVPIHMGIVEGNSLQLPLVVAVLRAFSAAASSDGTSIPFNPGPVFATGTILANGEFATVARLEEKFLGFVREYGNERVAILSADQQRQLAKSGLLDGQRTCVADNLAELLALDEFEKGLQPMCDSPPPAELDAILTDLIRLRRGVRFPDVERAAHWLLPHTTQPVYRFELLLHAGKTRAHQGDFRSAWRWLAQAEEVLAGREDLFGANERVRLAAAVGIVAFDAAEPTLGVSRLKDVEKFLPHTSPQELVAYHGMLCQLYREQGDWDLAIHHGEVAVKLADEARASDAGRDRNYLVHAFIARARSPRSNRQQDLDAAGTLLAESRRYCLPPQLSHLSFCGHYEAEIARLRGIPYDMSTFPDYSGGWDHARLFANLACARNSTHTQIARVGFSRQAADEAERRAPRGLLYGLLHHVYRLYVNYLCEEDLSPQLFGIRRWCEESQSGQQLSRSFPGWAQRLDPFVARVEQGDLNAVEDLCDAIPYH